MDATNRYIDAVKTRLNLPSDGRLAAHWNVTRQRISNYRMGLTAFSDDRCIEVAKILDLPPEQVLFEIQADRARKQGHDSIAEVFDRVLKRLAHAPAVVTLTGAFLALASIPSDAVAYDGSNSATMLSAFQYFVIIRIMSTTQGHVFLLLSVYKIDAGHVMSTLIAVPVSTTASPPPYDVKIIAPPTQKNTP